MSMNICKPSSYLCILKILKDCFCTICSQKYGQDGGNLQCQEKVKMYINVRTEDRKDDFWCRIPPMEEANITRSMQQAIRKLKKNSKSIKRIPLKILLKVQSLQNIVLTGLVWSD